MSSNFTQRLIVGSTVGALALLLIYFSHTLFWPFVFTLILATVIGAAQWEYYQIAEAKGFHPQTWIGIGASFLYFFATFFKTQTDSSLAHVLPLIVLGLALITIFLKYFVRGSDPFVNSALTFFGITYLAIPLSFLIYINFLPKEDGRYWMFYLFLVTKLTDTGAYFIGKLYGKRKLAPYISPKKTWEGAAGGLVVAIAVSLIFYLFVNLGFSSPPIALGFWQSIFWGALLSGVAQFGDLAESLLKRDGGIKDSNRLPGLGGILDMVDSLVFAAPLLYILIVL
jgi:phosphatidate cytidylyltransferase